MLPKSERFTKKDFEAVRPKVFFRGSLFDLAYCSLPTRKFACVISKKTIKLSVTRNLIKRRFFNAFRTFIFKKDQSIVIYPKKESVTASYTQIKEELQKAFATL